MDHLDSNAGQHSMFAKLQCVCVREREHLCKPVTERERTTHTKRVCFNKDEAHVPKALWTTCLSLSQQ